MKKTRGRKSRETIPFRQPQSAQKKAIGSEALTYLNQKTPKQHFSHHKSTGPKRYLVAFTRPILPVSVCVTQVSVVGEAGGTVLYYICTSTEL